VTFPVGGAVEVARRELAVLRGIAEVGMMDARVEVDQSNDVTTQNVLLPEE